MIGKFYVGHQVILRKRFVKYAYAHDLIGCHFNNYYFVSKKVVLLQRDKDANYIYVNSFNKCNVIDPNSLEVTVNILGCNQCNKKLVSGMDCQLRPDTPDEVLGVLDIQPITSFARTTDLSLAIELTKEYNNSIDEEDEYVYIDDECYIDTIRQIDDGVIKKKLKI